MLFDEAWIPVPMTRPSSNARRAYELYEDGKMAQALVALERALEVNPTNSAWHFNKGLTLDAISRFEEAIAEYELALELSPDDLEILNALAVDYTRTGLYDRALQTFEYIQQLDPKFEPCYCNRIITYAEMGQHDLAEQMFYLAQQIDEDCALCYYNIGNSLFARGEYKKAVRCWLRTAELEPTHPADQLSHRPGLLVRRRPGHRPASTSWPSCGSIPGDVEVIMDFALFLLETGDLDSAKEKFHRILELDPDFAPALFYLGEIALDQGDPDRAAELFEEALKKDPTLAGPHYRLAQCALTDGADEKARSAPAGRAGPRDRGRQHAGFDGLDVPDDRGPGPRHAVPAAGRGPGYAQRRRLLLSRRQRRQQGPVRRRRAVLRPTPWS